MIKTKQLGQSVLEVVFSVGILVMVITAVVSLIVKATGIKSQELQRKKATEMSAVVIEKLLEDKKNSPSSFWQLNDITTSSVSGYDGYSYTVDFSQNSEGNCAGNEVKCADALIAITWGNGQTFVVKRFFSK